MSSFIPVAAGSDSLNRLHQWLSTALAEVSPLILILSTAVVVAILSWIVCWAVTRRYRRKTDQRLASIVAQFVDERAKSETILLDLDLGVIAYGRDGVLINANPAARKMLAARPIPEKFNAFISEYGQENGMQAALLLGSETLSGTVLVQDRVIRLRVKLSHFIDDRASSFLVVLTDITEQESEEKQRKEFVANVSHELKTPLTIIKTYSESLLDWGLSEKSPEGIRKDIWRIHDDSLRMERLVEDLLLLSSIDSKGIRVRMEILDFAFLVRQAVDRLQHQAQEKNIELSCTTLSKIPPVFADRTAMERVLTNLVGNAIKYTDRNGQVKVYLSFLIDDVYVKVSDTGFGIEKDHMPRIFNRFYRVDMTGSRMYGGTGLGLSIAKELVELHNGKINVSSILGKGTEFTVMVPAARKVFRDALESFRTVNPTVVSMHRSAAQELQQAAGDLGFTAVQLGELTADDADALLSHVLARDDHTGPVEKENVPKEDEQVAQ
jgi:signal transduction histidine kinase